MSGTPTSVSRFLARAVRPSTLGARLVVVLALFITLVTVAVVGIQFVEGRAQLERESGQRLEADAALIGQRLARDVRERVRSASVWSQLEAAQDIVTDDIDKRLATTLERLVNSLGPADIGLAVNDSGRVVAASSASLMAQPPPSLVRAARSCAGPDGDAWRVDVVAGDDGPTLVVHDVIHARADDRPIGCLLLATPWSALVQAAVPAVDRDRVRVTRGGKDLWRGALLADGAAVVTGYAAVADAGLSFEVELAQPRAEVLASVRERGLAALLLAAAVMLVTLPVAFFVARNTARPLRALTESALALRDDDGAALAEPAPTAPREVHVLHTALDSMLGRLDQSRRAMAEREALASLGTMAAALAHEIRTPLAVVQSSAELLGLPTTDEERRGEITALVLAEVQRLERLVNDLLAFARPRTPDRGPGDLRDVVRRAAPLLESALAKHCVTLQVTLDPAPAWMDQEQCQQVFLNLVSNAVQFSPRGGVVHVTTASVDGRAVLTVMDHGRGIAPERLADIWKPFHTTRTGGTGLGLAIVRQIVDRHHGVIDVASAPGAGTTVRVALPETSVT